MMKRDRPPPDAADSHAEEMEVHGFDLLAQVEAMLRCVRDYQRNVQQLRRTAQGPATADTERNAEAAVLQQVKELRTACDTFCTTLDDIADSIAQAVKRRSGEAAAS